MNFLRNWNFLFLWSVKVTKTCFSFECRHTKATQSQWPIRRKVVSQGANQKEGHITRSQSEPEVREYIWPGKQERSQCFACDLLKGGATIFTNDKARLLVKPDSDLRGGSYSILNTTGSGIKKNKVLKKD